LDDLLAFRDISFCWAAGAGPAAMLLLMWALTVVIWLVADHIMHAAAEVVVMLLVARWW
jgi:hypothetical protein